MPDRRTTGPFSEALSTVYGVATARYAGNRAGAELLIRRHLEEAVVRGDSIEDAWSDLFSAAIVALCDVNADLALSRSTSPAVLMTSTALEHAAARVVP